MNAHHQPRTRLATGLFTAAAVVFVLTWLATPFIGLHARQGLFTFLVDDGALTIWFARPGQPNYVAASSFKLFSSRPHDFNGYVPLLTSTPTCRLILRAPFWLLVLMVGPPTILLWRRQLHSCRLKMAAMCPTCTYDRQGLRTNTCPECGGALNSAGPIRANSSSPDRHS